MEKQALTSKPTIIKITGFSFPKVWYKKHIGKEFPVESSTTRDFYVYYDGVLRGVLCKDAIIVN